MSETPKSVRLKIEQAKAALISLQETGPLGSESIALSVDTFGHLDKAWLAASRMEYARGYGQ